MSRCPDCGAEMRRRALVGALRDGRPATRALWQCVADARHRYAAWADTPDDLAPWTGRWWPADGGRPDLERERPPHW